jgi:membrane protease subunit HflK
MAWHEPDRDKDPWSGEDRPTDLDRIIRDVQKRIRELFGGSRHGAPRPLRGAVWAWVIPVLVAAWLLSGIYTVASAERAVVLRFGQYEYTALPGLHWHWPWPIETNTNVNVDAIRPYNYQASMLTQDENIIDVKLSVQYRVYDPSKYLFKVRNPRTTLAEVTDSALREVVGAHKMNFILGPGRAEIAAATQKLVQKTLKGYGAGLMVTSVNLQQAAPPSQVRDAFDDVKKASEDKQRHKNEAHSYANKILPNARGQAVRKLQQAKAYKMQAIAQAKGDASRFDQLLAAYRDAPQVTRKRLYLQTMQDVLGHTQKVVVDTHGGNKLIYLPLAKLLKQGGGASGKDKAQSEQKPSSGDAHAKSNGAPQ